MVVNWALEVCCGSLGCFLEVLQKLGCGKGGFRSVRGSWTFPGDSLTVKTIAAICSRLALLEAWDLWCEYGNDMAAD